MASKSGLRGERTAPWSARDAELRTSRENARGEVNPGRPPSSGTCHASCTPWDRSLAQLMKDAPDPPSDALDAPPHPSHSRVDPRTSPRIRLRTTGVMRARGQPLADPIGVQLVDVSLRGARLLAGHPCVVGQRFSIKLRFAPHLISAQVRVVWVKSRSGGRWELGVHMESMGDLDARRLAQVISQRMQPMDAANDAYYPVKPATSAG